MVCAWAVAALWFAGCGGVGGDHGTGVDMKDPGLGDRPVVGQSGSEGGCGYAVDGQPNVPFDFHIAYYGFSGADVAAAVEGSHDIDSNWQPWFEAPSAKPKTRSLTLDVEAQQKARIVECGWVEVIADVRVRDPESGIEIATQAKLQAHTTGGDDPQLKDVLLLATFKSTELATELKLPPAADASSDADDFDLQASFADGTWNAWLSSKRGGNSCTLLVPPPTDAGDDAACSEYAITMSVDAPQRVKMSEQFGPDHTVGDLAALARNLPAMRMRWPDGKESALDVEATVADFACVARKPGSHSSDVATDGKPWDVALVPLELHITTDDGKLDVTLPSAIFAAVTVGERWNGAAELDSAMTPLTTQTDTDWSAIIDRAKGDVGYVSLIAAIPVEDNEGYNQLSVETYRPYAGAPAPEVLEYASDRIACFSSGKPAHAVGLPLEPAK